MLVAHYELETGPVVVEGCHLHVDHSGREQHLANALVGHVAVVAARSGGARRSRHRRSRTCRRQSRVPPARGALRCARRRRSPPHARRRLATRRAAERSGPQPAERGSSSPAVCRSSPPGRLPRCRASWRAGSPSRRSRCPSRGPSDRFASPIVRPCQIRVERLSEGAGQVRKQDGCGGAAHARRPPVSLRAVRGPP